MPTMVVTGSGGLIGSATVEHFDALGWRVFGIDNNARAEYFGPGGDTAWNTRRLQDTCEGFSPIELDIRDRDRINKAIAEIRPDALVHAAAQPSHDFARGAPLTDFEVNALGTMHLLEAARTSCPDAVFVFISSSKVYGDRVNKVPLRESEKRFDFADAELRSGVPETFSIDQSMHSVFGASKCAADLMAQEYGRYFGLNTVVLRGGCLTGPAHSAVELHGFLNYLVKCAVMDRPYTIYGYGGKQVRDQIHSVDVARAIEAVLEAPPAPGEVFNLGGGLDNSASILECIEMLEHRLGRPVRASLSSEARTGDHMCYYSDLSKFRSCHPGWTLTKPLDAIIDEIIDAVQTSVR